MSARFHADENHCAGCSVVEEKSMGGKQVIWRHLGADNSDDEGLRR